MFVLLIHRQVVRLICRSVRLLLLISCCALITDFARILLKYRRHKASKWQVLQQICSLSADKTYRQYDSLYNPFLKDLTGLLSCGISAT